ncbi:hypothetical protein Stsp01_63410 [Streptomyces sp. NBRC 13847]|nr:hypothetical protein Stsp01_63410 [Streptomyces sp. NBRC 13847]
MQAGRAEQGAVQQRAVLGEAADGLRARRLQACGEGGGAQADGLDVVHVEGAEAAQCGGQGPRATACSSSAATGRSPGPAVRTARATSSVAILCRSWSERVRRSPVKLTSPEMRTGFATRPAPGPSLTKSFLMRGATTPEASRTPSADGSIVRSALPVAGSVVRGRCFRPVRPG